MPAFSMINCYGQKNKFDDFPLRDLKKGRKAMQLISYSRKSNWPICLTVLAFSVLALTSGTVPTYAKTKLLVVCQGQSESKCHVRIHYDLYIKCPKHDADIGLVARVFCFYDGPPTITRVKTIANDDECGYTLDQISCDVP